MKHELRAEQGHAVFYDKEVFINETETKVSNSTCAKVSDDETSELESKAYSKAENYSNDQAENVFDFREINDSLVLARKTHPRQKDDPKTNISKYETMEIVCSQNLSANGPVDVNDYQKLYCHNTSKTLESAYHNNEINDNIVADDKAVFEKCRDSDMHLVNDTKGNKHLGNEKTFGPQIKINTDSEMELYNHAKPDNLFQKDNGHKDHGNVDALKYNGRVDTSKKLITKTKQDLQNYSSKNEEESIYLDMNGFSKRNENVDDFLRLHVKVDDHTQICRPKQSTYKPITATTTLNTKMIQKEGFLQKQGGVDRNQGWKKRWFVLDAKSLRYYRDKKSSVSLRIIPVALMKSVSPVNNNRPTSITPVNVSDLFSNSGRQYQFTLECKQRTFLFGTDNLENCQKWQSTLMLAIIDYQKGNKTDIPYGGEMNSPDISGPVKFDNNKTRYYVAVKGKILRYYHNIEDYSVDCPIHELSMDMTSVKEIRKTSLQLDSPPDQKFILTFEQENDTQEWKTCLEAAKLRALGDDKVILKVWQNNDNRICADCYAPDPEWASVNLGIVICTKCAGPHRSLGVKRSKVKSLRMDNLSKENENILKVLETIGNKNSNLFWCKKVEDSWIVNEETPSIIRQRYVEEKYLKKTFADIMLVDSKEELNMALYSAVAAENIIATMVALFSGADMNSICPGQSKSILEVANETNNPVLKEFLEQNKNTDVATVVYVDSANEKSFSDLSKKTAIYRDGYLYKTGPNLKSYKKRWCVLHYGSLTYFSDKEGSDRGSVNLADATSVSIVTGQRKYSFDIDLQTKNRTYRFAAPDETMFGKWLNVVIQVICPYESEGLERTLIAGYFYFKKQLTFWAKVWLVLDAHALHIRHRDDSTVQTITISSQMKCLLFNVGKHSEKTEDVIRQLDTNQSIELISAEGHVVAYFQGMALKETKKLLCLLETAISDHL
ncbi:arf-GAP with Rho-GAP domain, ANK repeat and PH domain-containing protein 2-like isoform X2 [Ruditapes philippinarum]|nr:arf-GAP with Rho-GAP domain, ANK repeat and PH domain-containing protein 2-like isoform X2 [Ruditapes philippinarum]